MSGVACASELLPHDQGDHGELLYPKSVDRDTHVSGNAIELVDSIHTSCCCGVTRGYAERPASFANVGVSAVGTSCHIGIGGGHPDQGRQQERSSHGRRLHLGGEQRRRGRRRSTAHAVQRKRGHGRSRGGAVAAKPADRDRVRRQPPLDSVLVDAWRRRSGRAACSTL